jgi:putative SOS response-associated peptidase YedK
VTLTRDDPDALASELDAELAREDARLYRPRYNAAPSELLWIVEQGADRRVLRPALWGYMASGKPLINVRGEQVASGSGFREAFRSRRCAVVTDGFFEWTKAREPVWYHRPGGGLVLLAGLCQVAAAATGAADAGKDRRFTILTTRPNKLVAKVHGRMPAVLPAARLDEWLTAAPEHAAPLIAPAPEDALVATAVSRRVNSVKNDDPACLAPRDAAAEANAPGHQGKLFSS